MGFGRPLFRKSSKTGNPAVDGQIAQVELLRVETRCRSSAIDLRAARRNLERALKHTDDLPTKHCEEELLDAIGKIDAVLGNLLKGY